MNDIDSLLLEPKPVQALPIEATRKGLETIKETDRENLKDISILSVGRNQVMPESRNTSSILNSNIEKIARETPAKRKKDIVKALEGFNN